MADVATVLFTKFMKFDAKNPKWFDRDRFILSAGHGSMLLYSLGYLTGYEDLPIEQIKNFRQMGSKTAGHPEYGHVAIAETTTGPLGQGIATATGFALAEKVLRERHGADYCDHYTYVIAGDGCLMEGVSQEGISLAGHHQLNKLIVLWDDNHICIDGDTSKSTSEDQLKRFEASGWNTLSVDGHDPGAVERAIETARKSDKPTLIACATTIGHGAPTLAGSEKTHGAPLGDEEIAGMRANLNWPHEPFVVPEDVLSAWREAGVRGAAERAAWEARTSADAEFQRVITGSLPADFHAKMLAYKKQLSADAPKVATRKASEMTIKVVVPAIPEMVGGSADLAHSNLTIVPGMKPITAADANGNYMHWGIREHGMVAAVNGMVLHGGLKAYDATFFVFTDYCRPAIRLEALMEVPVIHIMTHDSIGLGEDGPTHQPVEHLASFRAMPNVLMLPPCDAVETSRMLGTGRRADQDPVDPRPVASGPADPAHHAHRRQPVRQGRLRDQRLRRRASGDHPGHRLGSRTGGQGSRHAGRERRQGRRGLDAVVGAVRRPGRRLQGLGARHRAARVGRGRGDLRLGTLRRLRRCRGRHDHLRRLGSGGRTLHPLRHHRRGGGRRGDGPRLKTWSDASTCKPPVCCSAWGSMFSACSSS